MLWVRQNHRCRGPRPGECREYCCPLKFGNKNGSLEYILGNYPYDIDHIKELENGGSNDLDNLQILCKTCHYTKTMISSIIKTDQSVKNNPDIMNIYKALCKSW